MKNKKAAIEMTMGTIVTIVLLVTVLIIGLVFVRSTMCAGIIATDQITTGMTNQIKNLFSTDEYGIKCMGESTQEIKFGDGGIRKFGCVAVVDEDSEYNLIVTEVKSLGGVSTENVQKWIIDKDAKNVKVSPGSKTIPVLTLNVPKQVSATTLKITIEEENLKTGSKDTHSSIIEIKHTGAVTSTVC